MVDGLLVWTKKVVYPGSDGLHSSGRLTGKGGKAST